MTKQKSKTNKTQTKKIENKNEFKGLSTPIKIDNLGILIQLMLSILLIIFVVYAVFVSEFYNLTVGILSALAFITAYNNHTVYKRNNFTIVYLVIGIAGVAFLIGTLF